MQLPRMQFRIGGFMVAVAIMACLLAWFEVVAVIAMSGLVLVVVVPTLLASPRRRIEVAIWASCLQPVVVLLYLYATWITAWCVLGYRPRPSLDDPKFISPIVDVPYEMFANSYAELILLGTGLLLVSVCFVRRSNRLLLLIVPVAWVTGWISLFSDPFGVFFWYAD